MTLRRRKFAQSGALYVPAAGGGFSPPSQSGLIGWYKADAGVFSDLGSTAAINGDPVQQWNDQSGTANHLINSAGSSTRPTFNTGRLNGLPGLAFAQANSQIIQTAAGASLGGTTLSVFMVIKASTPVANARVFEFKATADANDFSNATSVIAFYYPSTTSLKSFRAADKSAGTVVNNTAMQIGTIFDGTNDTLYVSGTGQTAVGSTGSFGATGVWGVTCISGGTEFFTGDVYEIIMYNADATANAANINTYLLGRWGV